MREREGCRSREGLLAVAEHVLASFTFIYINRHA